jgi:hypothetical protein
MACARMIRSAIGLWVGPRRVDAVCGDAVGGSQAFALILTRTQWNEHDIELGPRNDRRPTRKTRSHEERTALREWRGYSYAAPRPRLAVPKVAAVTRLARDERRPAPRLLRRPVSNVTIHESPQSTHMRLEYPTTTSDQRHPDRGFRRRPVRGRAHRQLDARAVSDQRVGPCEVPSGRACIGGQRSAAGSRCAGLPCVSWCDAAAALCARGRAATVLALVDVLIPSVEAEFLTDTPHPIEPLQRLRLRTAVGGAHASRRGARARCGSRVRARIALESAAQRRGDTCLGSYLSRRLDMTRRGNDFLGQPLSPRFKLEAEGRYAAASRRGRACPRARQAERETTFSALDAVLDVPALGRGDPASGAHRRTCAH